MLEYWPTQLRRRRIVTPTPARVRWRWAPADLASPRAQVMTPPVPGTGPSPLPASAGAAGEAEVLDSGVVTRLPEDVYLRLPHRRLVVLGEAGTGKTAAMILLLVAALERRNQLTGQQRAQLPVPVWLTLGSWNPDTTPLRQRAEHTLNRDHRCGDLDVPLRLRLRLVASPAALDRHDGVRQAHNDQRRAAQRGDPGRPRCAGRQQRPRRQERVMALADVGQGGGRRARHEGRSRMLDREPCARAGRGHRAGAASQPGAVGARLGVVSGRRRRGKSFLLQAFAEATGGLYFAAAEGYRGRVASAVRRRAQPLQP
jgi:hypothetical protein